MTDGSGPSAPSGARPSHVLSHAQGDQSARVVDISDALARNPRAQRVEAEVVRQNQDGSVRLRTPQGDVDVQVRGRQPQPGQILEVDIPAGNPPRQVVIRPAPPPPPPAAPPSVPPAPAQGSPAPVGTPPAAPSPSLPPDSAAPKPPAASPPAAAPVRPAAPLPPQQGQAAAPLPPPTAPLLPGTAVRLLPVPPGQAGEILQNAAPALENVPSTLTRASFIATLIALKAQGRQSAALQTLIGAKPADIAALLKPLHSAPVASLLPAASAAPSSAPANPILNLFIQTAAQPSVINSQIQIVTPPSLTAPLTAAPAPPAPDAPALLLFRPGADIPQTLPGVRQSALDVRLMTLQAPGVVLTPPRANANGPVAQNTLLPLPAPVAAPQAPAGSMTAQVAGFTPQGLPVVTLQWPGAPLQQTFILQFNAGNLQPGAQLTLQPQNPVPAVQPGAAAPQPGGLQPLPPLTLLGPGPWPLLDETYQTLLQSSPALAQTMARVLPSPANAAQMGPAALFFIAAVRSGDFGGWLGEKKIELLEKVSRNNLLGRLTQEMGSMARQSAEAAPGSDWRPVPLPLFWQGEVQRIALFVKQDGGGTGEDSDSGDQTRFIFELDLPRMGDVQLDGLMRGPRLDLIVRTQTPFSPSMQQAMRQSYSRALEDTSLHGDLSFQGDPKYWVQVMKKQDSLLGVDT